MPSPASLGFGIEATGTIGAARTLTLTSSGDAPLVVERVRVAGSHAEDFLNAADSCAGETIAPGATCTIKLRFAPSAQGSRSAVLKVFSNAPGRRARRRLERQRRGAGAARHRPGRACRA